MRTSSREQGERRQEEKVEAAAWWKVGRSWCRHSRHSRQALGEGLREPEEA